MITAVPSSTPTYSPTTPKLSANRTRATSAARSANSGSTCNASRCGSPTGSPGRRVILLTVFYKTQRAEVAEVGRALAVQKECEAAHRHAVDVYDRRSSDE